MTPSLSSTHPVQLVVVGSIALDTIQTPVDRREHLLGGSVSYACSAASFFTKVGMVGIVGEDFPAEYMDLYERRFGIDLCGLSRAPGKTFTWAGRYEADMNSRRTLSLELNVFESFSPILPDAYRQAPFLFLGNISPELQLHVLSQAESPRFVVADTMDHWIQTARESLWELMTRVDMLTLNDSEARLLTGEENLRTCADKMLNGGPSFILIKKGEHGAMLVDRNGTYEVPAYIVDHVQDPTGAGDSFAGGFMGVLAQGSASVDETLKESLLYGSVVASFGVEEFGLKGLEKLTKTDIENRLLELKKRST